MGMDLAPSLAAHLKMPLATDCIGIDLEGGSWHLPGNFMAGR